MDLRPLASPSTIVLPRQIMDYRAFSRRFGRPGETELHIVEKFHAAKLLTEMDYPRIYVNVLLEPRPPGVAHEAILADVCGERDWGEVFAVFCEVSEPSPGLLSQLSAVRFAENAKALLVCPSSVDLSPLLRSFTEDFESGKFAVERVGFSSLGLEEAFREALELVDLLCNETRVKMLLPLLINPRRKGQYRKAINPKLVYENLSFLRSRGLIEELVRDEYALTPLGGRVLCEYIAFLEKVRRTLEEAKGQGGVGQEAL